MEQVRINEGQENSNNPKAIINFKIAKTIANFSSRSEARIDPEKFPKQGSIVLKTLLLFIIFEADKLLKVSHNMLVLWSINEAVFTAGHFGFVTESHE